MTTATAKRASAHDISPPSTPALSDSASTESCLRSDSATSSLAHTSSTLPSAAAETSSSVPLPPSIEYVVSARPKKTSITLQRSSSDNDRRRLSSTSSASSSNGSSGHGATAPPAAQRPRLFHSSSTSSRPSSVASNSSSQGGSSAGGATRTRFAVSASLLSPSLATALGIYPDGTRRQQPHSHSHPHHHHHHSQHSADFYANPQSASCTSLTGLLATASTQASGQSFSRQSGQRQRKARGDSFGSSTGRRPSLPSAASCGQNRISMASIASFESLPEGESVPVFALSPALRASQSRRESDAQSTASELLTSCPANLGSPAEATGADIGGAAALMLPPPSLPPHTKGLTGCVGSPPTSPVVASPVVAGADDSAEHSGSMISASSGSDTVGRRGILKRALTEPSNGAVGTYGDKMRKRALVVRELLSTERIFVESLQVIHDFFYQPLLSRCGGVKGSPQLNTSDPPLLSRKAVAEVFSNFVDILKLNTELLGRLEDRISGKDVEQSRRHQLARRRGSHDREASSSSSPPTATSVTCFPSVEDSSSDGTRWDPEADTIGDILVPIAPFLKMYSLYVKNFSSALARIESERRDNEAFAKFLKETERSTWGRGKAFFGLGLPAHLLTVVQRIPRYTLLFGELLKNTPIGHHDHHDLAKAYAMVEQVATSINENVRKHEMAMLILSLQKSLSGLTTPLVVPGRALVKRGTLLKACRKDIQARAFFLFNDCIVYARPNNGTGAPAIESAWKAITRAGGMSGAGRPGDLAGPWSTPSASASRLRQSLENQAQGSSPLGDPLQARTRASSGNLLSSNAILEALQAAAAAQTAPQLQFRDKFALQDCTVIGVEDSVNPNSASASSTEAGGTPWSFEIRTPDKSFAVYAESAASRDAWVNAIREARNEWLQARRTLRTEEDSIEAKRDRRRSVAAAAAAAKARHSVYSLALSSNPSIPEGQEMEAAHCNLAIESVAAGGSDYSATAANGFSGARPRASLSLASMPTSTSFAALLNSAGHATGAQTPTLRVLEEYNAPAWVPDSRADRCMSCSETFGIWRRKHHCRLCGRVVCWNCSTRKFVIASYDDGKEDTVARACDACYESTFPDSGDEGQSGESDAEEGCTASQANGEQRPRRSSAASSSFGSGHQVLSADGKKVVNANGNVRFVSLETTPGSPLSQHESDHPHAEEGAHTERPREDGADTQEPISAQRRGSDNDSSTMLVTPLQQLSLNAVRVEEGAADRVGVLPQEGEKSRRRQRLSLQGDFSTKTGSAAQAMISTSGAMSSMPTVQAATSGTGTFRLAPPQITTPEDELPRSYSGRSWYGCNPAASTSSRSLVGQGDGYFAGAAIPEEQEGGPVAFPSSGDAFHPSDRQPMQAHRRERINSSASVSGHEVDTRLQHRPSRRKPLSAAARLSTYYGNSLAAGPLVHDNGQSKHHQRTQGSARAPDAKTAHVLPSPLRKASN
ncbi:unnamed protein product [Parajaminaea phylloscopi]